MLNFLNKTSFSFFLKQRWILLTLILNLIFNFLIWAWVIWRVKPTTELIPLSFNLYFGIDFLGNWQYIFYGPILGLLIIVINYFFANLSFRNNKFFSFWLIFTALFIQFFLLIYYFFLILNYY